MTVVPSLGSGFTELISTLRRTIPYTSTRNALSPRLSTVESSPVCTSERSATVASLGIRLLNAGSVVPLTA